jgi:hypothetical protein
MPTTMDQRGNKEGWLRAERRRLPTAAMCAESRARPDSGGSAALGQSRAWQLRSNREPRRALRGTSRPLDASPGLADGRGPLSRARGRGSPTGEPASSRPRRFLPSDPARIPAQPPSAAPRPRRQPPAAQPSHLTSAPLRADVRAGGPGQQAPRRAGVRGAGHRRTSARAAAAASRRAPLRSPITQRPGSASRATADGGLARGRSRCGDGPTVAAAADGERLRRAQTLCWTAAV